MTNLEIDKAYIGDTQVEKIYLGDTEIYSTGPTPVDYRSMPLTIEALSGGTLQLTNTTSQTDIYYNLNDDGWQLIGTDNMSFNLQAGDIIQFGATEAVDLHEHSAGRSLFSGNTLAFKVYGNIESLEYGKDNFISQDTVVYMASAFTNCFETCYGLTDASNLVLPATGLGWFCYYRMFRYCTSLTSAPALPAETVLCGSYYGMFQNCTSLTTAPSLPATRLSIDCYYQMFAGCTSLTTAPELPATSLTPSCYEYMFQGCRSLNYIKCLASASRPQYSSNCKGWVYGVASTGTFIRKAGATSWPTGNSGIPSGWTKVDDENPGDGGDTPSEEEPE